MHKKFCCVFFLQFLEIKTLDPDPYPDSSEMPDPDSLNPDPQFWFEPKEIYIVPEDSRLESAT